MTGDGGEPRVTVRKTDRGVLVVVDLRGVVRNDDETEIDLVEDSLILRVDGRFSWRVPIDDGRTSISDVSLNNDVLSARVDVGE